MRVRGNHENALLVIKGDGRIIKTVKKKRLTPGEMLVLKVNKEDLTRQQFQELTVDLEKEKA